MRATAYRLERTWKGGKGRKDRKIEEKDYLLSLGKWERKERRKREKGDKMKNGRIWACKKIRATSRRKRKIRKLSNFANLEFRTPRPKQSAAQQWALFRYMPIMIADFVVDIEEAQEYYEVFLILHWLI